jgi:hypothetical protein
MNCGVSSRWPPSLPATARKLEISRGKMGKYTVGSPRGAESCFAEVILCARPCCCSLLVF